ncbi:MAG: glycoside hydrolase [Acidobacteria bacterium]|nr:MAG: glycoside hydrolase [Acidobacteriota bacterium]
MRWRVIGPFRGGRTRAVAGVPSQPNVFYIGAVDGGVWKSTDYGRTWNPIFDGQPSQSIGAIAVSPSNPETIFVASGEGLQRPDLSVGNGIYKSVDAGKTWTHLGLREGQQIPALAIDPRDPNRIFAAVLGHPYGANPERGIFRSTDGGATWQKVLYKDENTGGSDVEIDPSNPEIVYAALWQSRLGPWEDNNAFAGTGGGLFKSTDGGNTWKKLAGGLPDDLVQINVAIAPSQPKRLYATLATTKPSEYASGKGLGFYRSDDGGESWTQVTSDPRPAMKIGGGDLPISRVDPKNSDVVYSASIVTVRSIDGGKTWTSIRGAPGGDDYQNLWINPNDPKIILLVADQGAIVSVNGGETWSSWYNQPTAQIYHVSVMNTFPYKVCGGQQESGSVCIASRGNDGEITFRDWHPVGVIEYGYVAPDPLDHDIVYGAGRNEVSRFHWSTGQVENVTPIPIRDGYRVDRTEPIMFSPADPHVLYYATNVLFGAKDGGHSWQKISPDLARKDPGVPASVADQAALNPKAVKQRGAIYSLAPSFHNVNTIWAGTDDGLVWITRDAGKNWKDITPQGLSAWSKVTQISASHFDDETAYASVSRFRIDDMRPYVYRTHDGGKSWREISSGLPDDSSVNTVREDPVRKGLLFAGTETAVWVSFDDGDHWQSLQLNLPHTSMRDLWVHDNDLIVATHGRSFWILDDISPLRQLSSTAANSITSGPHLFTPEAAYRVRHDTNTDTPLPADEPAGENPPDGAIIDYLLPAATTGPATLEILDAQGKLVRRFSNTDKPEPSAEELETELIPQYWLRPARVLSSEAGMHRWVWDLRYASPNSTIHEYPIAAVPHDTPRNPRGPLVTPGKYSVRLTANGRTLTAELTVKMDPRVKATAADLQKQLQLEIDVVSGIGKSSEAVTQARSIREQIAKLLNTATDPLKGQLRALDAKLAGLLEGGKEPGATGSKMPSLGDINGNLVELYKQVEHADAAPTQAQVEASTKSEAELGAMLTHWNQLKSSDIPSLNQQLKSAGLPPLRFDLPPQQQEGGQDEE